MMKRQKFDNPFISVIIPTYNREHLVTEAIDSVISQTYQDFELLVVDDYSTDRTEDVVKSYKDPRVKYVANERAKGAQGSRNTGLYAAKGNWTALLNSDDIWFLNKLEKQVQYVNHASAPIVGLGCGYAGYDFVTDKVLFEKISDREICTTEDLLFDNYLGGSSVFLFKKDCALKIDGFDEQFPAMQDMDFYIRLSQAGDIHTLKEVLVYQRISNTDRITFDYEKKLASVHKFRHKYDSLINRSTVLKSRAVYRQFYFSWLNRDIKFLLYFLLFCLLLIMDYRNFIWLFVKIKKRAIDKLQKLKSQ